MKCDFLGAADLEALTVFHSFNERGGMQEAFVCAHVEPGNAVVEDFYIEAFALQVLDIYIGDFEFAARAGSTHECSFEAGLLEDGGVTRHRQVLGEFFKQKCIAVVGARFELGAAVGAKQRCNAPAHGGVPAEENS